MPETTTGAVAGATTGTAAGREPIRLVCLPFGGSGTSFFRPWDELTGDRFEVLPLRLPGREHLIDVEPYRDVHLATDGLLADLLEELGGPARVVLFGHSVGAVLAFIGLATFAGLTVAAVFFGKRNDGRAMTAW